MAQITDTFTRLRDRIAADLTAHLGPDPGDDRPQIAPDTRIAEVLPDSLDRFELVMLAEEMAGRDLADADIEAAVTFGDLAALIDRQRAAA